jgi:glyoxylate reductase
VTRRRVHVAGSVPTVVTEALTHDFELVPEPDGADGILALVTTRVDGEYLDAAGSQLEIVANYGVGLDNIDLDAARSRSIQVANTPDVLTKATAELALALTLSLLRRVTEGDRFLRSRKTWSFSLEFMLGEGLDGKIFGVVGPGRIGRETARLAEATTSTPSSAPPTSSASTAR